MTQESSEVGLWEGIVLNHGFGHCGNSSFHLVPAGRQSTELSAEMPLNETTRAYREKRVSIATRFLRTGLRRSSGKSARVRVVPRNPVHTAAVEPPAFAVVGCGVIDRLTGIQREKSVERDPRASVRVATRITGGDIGPPRTTLHSARHGDPHDGKPASKEAERNSSAAEIVILNFIGSLAQMTRESLHQATTLEQADALRYAVTLDLRRPTRPSTLPPSLSP